MGINYKGSQGQTERAVALEDDDDNIRSELILLIINILEVVHNNVVIFLWNSTGSCSESCI